MSLSFGLALGGGGARGLAHLPVLAGLEEEHITPNIVTGTSMGALMATLYVRLGSATAVKERLLKLVESEAFRKLGTGLIKPKTRGGASFWHQAAARIQDRIVINLAQSKLGLIPLERLETALAEIVADAAWECEGRRLGIVATNLITGADHYFTEGNLLRAVMASMAIPGFVPPVEIDGQKLIDGGVSQIIPIRLARQMGADFVLAVDVGRTVTPTGELDNAMAIMSQSEAISSFHYRKVLAAEADVLIRPSFTTTHWSEYDRFEELVGRGTNAFRVKRMELRRAWYRKRHPVLGRLKEIWS